MIAFTLTSVVVRSDLAVATVNYSAAVPAGKDAAGKATPAMNLQGNWMQILRKQPDGSWKISAISGTRACQRRAQPRNESPRSCCAIR